MLNFLNKIINNSLHKENTTLERKDEEKMNNEKVRENKSEIIRFLSGFSIIKTFDTEVEQNIGLLKYKNIPFYAAFIFRFKEEKIRHFHTVGMMFNIDIYFFNKKGKLVSKHLNCKSGLEDLCSVEPSKYVVEIKSKEV